MNKIIFFIDGFNLYHSLDANPNYHKYKWLDLAKLSSLFTTKKDKLVDIYYFTALATWNTAKANRHKIFIKAQELMGVKIVYGEFKIRDKRCRKCHQFYEIPEENKRM